MKNVNEEWITDLRDDVTLFLEILEARLRGNTDELRNGDEDLLAAAETAHEGLGRLVTEWRGY